VESGVDDSMKIASATVAPVKPNYIIPKQACIKYYIPNTKIFIGDEKEEKSCVLNIDIGNPIRKK
jgi:hypothetical protein